MYPGPGTGGGMDYARLWALSRLWYGYDVMRLMADGGFALALHSVHRLLLLV